MRRVLPGLALVAVAMVAGGCGGGDDPSAPPGPSGSSRASLPTESSPRPADRCPAGATRSYVQRGLALVLRRPAAAYRAPGGAVVARFERLNANGVATTFRALAARLGPSCRPAWYRVQLPIRPNGAQGWVAAAAVRGYMVSFRILIDLSDRRVTVLHDGRVLVQVSAGVGRPETPTPTGSYYVNQRLLAADPSGPWGPGGIGISAFSPVLVDWAQGGPIAIHGTNEPETIGQAASHGCVRIDNDVLARLIRVVPDGTPVRIRD